MWVGLLDEGLSPSGSTTKTEELFKYKFFC